MLHNERVLSSDMRVRCPRTAIMHRVRIGTVTQVQQWLYCTLRKQRTTSTVDARKL